jgi:CRP-like cAMP-binding protein
MLELDTYQIVAYVAAGVAGLLVCVSFFMKTIIPLRVVAIASNLGFILYGVLTRSWPVLLLHAALLPINLFRAIQMIRLTRQVRSAASVGNPSEVWLRPYMKTKRFAKGDILFRKGDAATLIYFLASGRIEFVEIGTVLEPGHIFGEIAFFTPAHQRLLTARCIEDCTVLSVGEETLMQLYFQNPEFGFYLVKLVAERLASNVERLEARLEEKPAAPP